MKITLLLLTVLLATPHLCSATESKEINITDEQTVIQGDMSLSSGEGIFTREAYLGEYKRQDITNRIKAVSNITIDDTTLLVGILTQSTEKDLAAKATSSSLNWANHGHPLLATQFPNALPMSLLQDKKEGDTLKLTALNKSNEHVAIALRCTQRSKDFAATLLAMHQQHSDAQKPKDGKCLLQ